MSESAAEEVKQEATPEPTAKPSADEILAQREERLTEKAKEQGWKSLEEHLEAGGDPGEWRPAGEFLQYGEMQQRIKSFEKGFEHRADRLEKYYKAQMKVQKEDLESRLEKAIEDGDKDEIKAANKAIREHDKIEAENKEQPKQLPPELTEWNSKNAWINKPGAKSTYAKTVFIQAMNAGSSVSDALALVDNEIAREFPSQEKRGHVPESESGKHKGFKKSSRPLSWGDLSEEERKVFDTGVFGDDKDKFLKAAKDARDAEERENGR